MKIYQIHCYGGEWEDSFDYILSSYANEYKAIEKLKELNNIEDDKCHCNRCPIFKSCKECEHLQVCILEHDGCDYKYCNKRTIELIGDYCNNFSQDKDYQDGICCTNAHFYDDDRNYSIEEVEVIE